MEAKNGNNGGGGSFLSFEIELKPGQTTIVSWKRLLQQANNQPQSPEPEAEADEMPFELVAKAGQGLMSEANNFELLSKDGSLLSSYLSNNLNMIEDDYIQVENERTENSGSIVNLEKVQQMTARTESSSKSANVKTKKRRKDKMESLAEKDDVQIPTKYNKKGHHQTKVAAKKIPSLRPHSSSQVLNVQNEYDHDSNVHNSINYSLGNSLKGHSDSTRSADPVDNMISYVSNAPHQKFKEKNAAQLDPEYWILMSNTNEQEGSSRVRHGNRKRKNELPDLNIPYTGPAQRNASIHSTYASDVAKLKDKVLERAILRLEKFVEDSVTPLIGVQEVDASSVEVERRLPLELKEELAKVARLAWELQHFIEGKISEELTDRLMSILGTYLHRKTLKRILREMVLKQLSAIKEEGNAFKQIKKEIIEMIRVQAPSLKSKELAVSDDEGDRGIYSMHITLEDKLCDLYDTYVQGLDEDIGRSLIKKLYVQLAELWPKGTMDNHGIRNAICRAKERKRALSSEEKGLEKRMRKKLSTPRTDEMIREKGSSVTQPLAVPKRLTTDTKGLVLTSPKRSVSSLPIADHYLGAPFMSSVPSKGSSSDLVGPEESEVSDEPSMKPQEVDSKFKKLSLKSKKVPT